MKKHIAKLTALSLFAAAVVAVPVFVSAQDASTNALTSSQSTSAKSPKHRAIPFRGKLDAVNADAMTLTVGKRTLQVTSDTKIFKDDKPATLSEGVVGEPVRGAYQKTEAGKLEALSVHFGAKKEKKAKKKTDSNEE